MRQGGGGVALPSPRPPWPQGLCLRDQGSFSGLWGWGYHQEEEGQEQLLGRHPDQEGQRGPTSSCSGWSGSDQGTHSSALCIVFQPVAS